MGYDTKNPHHLMTMLNDDLMEEVQDAVGDKLDVSALVVAPVSAEWKLDALARALRGEKVEVLAVPAPAEPEPAVEDTTPEPEDEAEEIEEGEEEPVVIDTSFETTGGECPGCGKEYTDTPAGHRYYNKHIKKHFVDGQWLCAEE